MSGEVFDLPAPFRRSPTEYLRLEVSIDVQFLNPGSASNGQCSRLNIVYRSAVISHGENFVARLLENRYEKKVLVFIL